MQRPALTKMQTGYPAETERRKVIMFRPTLEEVKAYAADPAGYRVVPVMKEIMADIRTPMEVLRRLLKVSRHTYMLESVENTDKWGRYTFLGFDPKLELTCTDGKLKISTGTTIEVETNDPGQYIRKILAENKSPKIGCMPSFTGGLVGYFSYDFIKYAEPKLRLDAEDQENFNDFDLMLFDRVIAFDNLRQRIVIIANVPLADVEVLEVLVTQSRKM